MNDVTVFCLCFIIGVALAKFCMFLTDAHARRKIEKADDAYYAKLRAEAEARAKQYQIYLNTIGDMEMRAYAEHRPVYATKRADS